jgi:hypothetical protein
MALPITWTNIYGPVNIELGRNASPNSGTYDWTHITPTDFEVPWDMVSSATLEIKINRLNEADSTGSVIAETVNLGDVESWTNVGNQYTTNIGTVFTTWTNGSPLHISLSWATPDTYVVRGGSTVTIDNYIKFVDATFVLVYTNEVEPSNQIPEPTTMLLLGLGLLGVAGIRRFKK